MGETRPPMPQPGMGPVRMQVQASVTPLMQAAPPRGPPTGPPVSQGPPVSSEGMMRPRMPAIQPLMSAVEPRMQAQPPVSSAPGPADAGPRPSAPRGPPPRPPVARPSAPGGPSPEVRPVVPPGVTPTPRPTAPVVRPQDTGPKLPAALERMLEFKTARAMQVGDKVEKGEVKNTEEADSGVEMEQPHRDSMLEEDDDMEDEEEEETTTKEKRQEKNRRRKKKKKRARSHRQVNKPAPVEEKAADEAVEVEYVPEEPEISKTDPLYWQFAGIFANFK